MHARFAPLVNKCKILGIHGEAQHHQSDTHATAQNKRLKKIKK